MGRREIALSEKVLEELRSNFALCAVYLTMFGRWDPDIHPLHNKDWVAATKKREEEERLPAAEAALAAALTIWKEIRS